MTTTQNKTLRHVGLTREKVAALCAKHFGTGIRGKHNPIVPKTDPAKVTRIIQMRSEGRMIRDIAKEVRIAASTVSYILNGRKQ